MGAALRVQKKDHSWYQGSQSSGHLLRKTSKTYSFTAAPLPVGSESLPANGNALLTSITTVDDSGQSRTTAMTYGGTFAAVMPTCGLVYNTHTSAYECDPLYSGLRSPVNLTLSIPTSSTITDSAANTLVKTVTQYKWQEANSPYLAANILDTPSSVTSYDGSSPAHQVQQSTTTYDETGYIANSGVVGGHATTVSLWNNNGNDIQTHTAWTAYGMVDHTIDGRGHTDAQYSYNYQAFSSQYINLYPDSVSNALSQVSSFTWDPNSGRIASNTDPNGVVTSYAFKDPRGRVTQIRSAVGTPEESWKSYSYPNSTTVNVALDQSIKGDQAMTWSTVADGLGRPVQQFSPNGSVVDTQYDGLDQVVSVSNPYVDITDPTYGVTTFAYDALGRKTLQTQPDNTTLKWCYNGEALFTYQDICSSTQLAQQLGSGTFAWTDQTDETGVKRQQISDTLGRLVAVVELGTGSAPLSLETDYGYNTNGNLQSVTQWGTSSDLPRIRNFAYDSLSRLIYACNPEGLATGSLCTDTSKPGTTYTYDGNGNVQTKTTNRGVISTFTYDSLDRLVSKVYSYAGTNSATITSVTATPNVCYQYDGPSSLANAVGNMTAYWTVFGGCASTAPSSGYQTLRSILAYDSVGRVLKEQQCTPASCSPSHPTPVLFYQYWLAGQLNASNNGVVGENAMTFSNQYDAAGNLIQINALTNQNNLQYPSVLFSTPISHAYNAAGGLTSWTLGTGITATRTYDKRLRLTKELAYGYR